MEKRIYARITVDTGKGRVDCEIQTCRYVKKDDWYDWREEDWGLDSSWHLKDGHMVDINVFSLMSHYERLGIHYFIRII